MSLSQSNVRAGYLFGLKNLIGSDLVNDRMSEYVYEFDFATIQDVSNIYYLITRGMIEDMSTDKCRLSETFKDGLAEDIAIRISDAGSLDFENTHKMFNDHWAPYHVSRILLDVVGGEEGTICVLKKPDLFSELLGSIKYDDSTLLDYLNTHLGLTHFDIYSLGCSKDLGRCFEAVNCVEAISNCSGSLQLPSKRLERHKRLAKAKAKLMGKGNEKAK